MINHCGLCGKSCERFGTLIDPNGHKWVMCTDCINSLWEDRQPNLEPEVNLADEIVNKLWERMLNGVTKDVSKT